MLVNFIVKNSDKIRIEDAYGPSGAR
jgi:hypothetical protein